MFNPARQPQHRDAVAHLRRVDARMARLVDVVGPCGLQASSSGTHFEALARSIAYQQVTGKAAATIHGRVKALGTGGKYPVPARILRLGVGPLRAAGLSRQKTAAVLDLARHCQAGTLPLARLGRLSDVEVIEALTQVRGIGQWTAEMILIFRLGRPDVLPATDYGIQKGLVVLDGRRSHPKPAHVLERGAAWAPYRSVASWYLWRACERGSIA